MKKLFWLMLALTMVALFASSCAFFEWGWVTPVDPGDPGDNDPDDPTGDATPTSWYVLHNFSGSWTYQFFQGATLVQTYNVDHQVTTGGTLDLVFHEVGSEENFFRGEGTIDMNTGTFSASCVWGQVGANEGDLNLEGTFATQTSHVEPYSAELIERFSVTPVVYNYTVGANKNP
ncbi:MAG TPA: hypothetical protein P5560_07080 [Thermotogota bacterium]|nr:hypothetical protein [Thermotogota bacterium]HRW92689.1 hypothetical protein [Thermotogota bacterium]